MEIKLYKYNPTGITLVGFIDDCISYVFQRSFSQIGTFQIVLDPDSLSAELIKQADMIRSSTGVAGYITEMIMDTVEEVSTLTVKGFELKGITSFRGITPPDGSAYFNVNNTPEYVMAQLINTQIVSPSDTKRAIYSSVASYANSVNLHMASYRYTNLKDELSSIAVAYGIGWYADIEGGKIVFRLTHGIDRSASQTSRSRIVLSYANDSILKSSLSANYALPETLIVAGQGEGTSRVIYIVNDDKEGLQRKEALIDARDISDEALLPDRGYAKLAEYGSGIAYSCTLSESFLSLYRQAFDLGDIVTAEDETLNGGSLDAYITSITEVYENSGIRVDIVLGYDTNTIQGALSRISSSTKSLVNTDTVTYDVITTMETTITQMNGYIATKAEKTTTDALGNDISKNYSEYRQDAESFTYRIGVSEGDIKAAKNDIGDLQDFKEEQETYIKFDTAGVHVGKSGVDGYKAETLVAPDGLHIKDNNGTECAYFTDNKSYIKNAQITDTWQMGGFQYIKFSTGRVSMKWVG